MHIQIVCRNDKVVLRQYETWGVSHELMSIYLDTPQEDQPCYVVDAVGRIMELVTPFVVVTVTELSEWRRQLGIREEAV